VERLQNKNFILQLNKARQSNGAHTAVEIAADINAAEDLDLVYKERKRR